MTVTERLVLSASRRTDLVGCYPEILIERLKKYPPDLVHTVVIWTKNPANMLGGKPLGAALREYRQLYVHFTITGMGGGDFEPNIPPWEESVAMLEPLLELAKTPERISWRFDPILEAERDGERAGNRELFFILARKIAPWGIRKCRMSWVSPYRKVVARMRRSGWRLIAQTEEEKKAQARAFETAAGNLGMVISYCSMEGFPTSSCIDGEFLSRLHPDGLHCSQEKAKGQRKLCGCTKSLDIGWYTDRCQHGCLYCYALP